MSHFKTDEQVEFAELYSRLEARGLKAVDVARKLKITAPAISMLRSGKNNPHPSTLEDLRKYVQEVYSEPASHHGQSVNETELWRGRARRAERELADLKNGLRELLARPSSKVLASADKIEKEIRGSIRTGHNLPTESSRE
ncbi:MAG: helix-turn-helix transcriptional regulator [Verrucomicrobiota bacterium]